MFKKRNNEYNDGKLSQNYFAFTLLIIFQLWLAHAMGFFPHEYAHAITAWLFGWKANPLAINYGHPSVAILLAQFGINENVNYTPIFTSGHGWQAGTIAAAGMVIGNMLVTYPLSRWLYAIAKRRKSRIWAMFSYWFTVASIGNFIDYVPVRTFATGGDMYRVAKGFNCSPWLVLLVLGIPTFILVVHFFQRIESQTILWLFPESPAKRGIMVLLTALALFGFYGAAGWVEDCGPESRWISIISVFVLVPLMTVFGWRHTNNVRLAEDRTD